MSSIPLVLTIAGLAIGLSSLGVAIWIAARQRAVLRGQGQQLDQLGSIAVQTAATAKELQTESHVQDNVKAFFSSSETRAGDFCCFFPVKFQQGPFPFVAAGDYHALQVLSSPIGHGNIELRMLGEENPNIELPEKGNIIFLCAPSANAALRSVFKPDKNDPPSGLPCWFVEEVVDDMRMNRIAVFKDEKIVDRVYSETLDKKYVDAKERTSKDFTQFFEEGTWTDYGILARITAGNRRFVVLAGNHQAGTWAVADFFDRLLRGESVDYSDMLIQRHDFVAVVRGEFKKSSLRVTRCSIQSDYLWTKEAGSEWTRIPEGAKVSRSSDTSAISTLQTETGA